MSNQDLKNPKYFWSRFERSGNSLSALLAGNALFLTLLIALLRFNRDQFDSPELFFVSAQIFVAVLSIILSVLAFTRIMNAYKAQMYADEVKEGDPDWPCESAVNGGKFITPVVTALNIFFVINAFVLFLFQVPKIAEGMNESSTTPTTVAHQVCGELKETISYALYNSSREHGALIEKHTSNAASKDC